MYAIVTPGDEKVTELAGHIIELWSGLNFLSPMSAVDSLSLLATYCAKFLERHIHKPRNPAKRVMGKCLLISDTFL
jgi:glucosamine 6-phosphate synthetase-like amidotransferase/phosphosugar isomerase protein